MKKSSLSEHSGFGSHVPPYRSYVTVYFLEKGATEKAASDFFEEYSGKDWKNKRGTLIRNWKVHAWTWIYYSMGIKVGQTVIT